ncbi:hypothetical protein DVA67_030710 [Solirubrobacter sp. CPCC 204708]|uniref:Uncharacterized protein n=1 Tax=Solirubrobacter deserti TaxID=2282478 RepID=A0ABT4RLR6_9ACTN|nr:hypothetical protein [Solirubrobacter deserti]MBE2320375.1 hypothetical protein [Solirubrobacter deserti]MDA0139430.1 hypothetical protein [Solirubrobacter deserti]
MERVRVEAPSPPLGRVAEQAPAQAFTSEAILSLQRCAGNQAVVEALRSGRIGGPWLLRSTSLEPYLTTSKTKSNTGELAKIGKKVQLEVDRAVKLLHADPGLKAHGAVDGYLGRWVKTWDSFKAKPSELPPFFFARYGYAVETLTQKSLEAIKIAPYEFTFQVAHGHTRPDIVVLLNGEEVAWIDITSHGSPDHILKKTGSQWKTRQYVAEVRYDTPVPQQLGKGTLTKADKAKFEAAAQHAERAEAARNAALDSLLKALNQVLGKSYYSKSNGRAAIRRAIDKTIGHPVSPGAAKAIVELLDDIEVKELDGTVRLKTGSSVAAYMFRGIGASVRKARRELEEFGAPSHKRKAVADPVTEESDDDVEDADGSSSDESESDAESGDGRLIYAGAGRRPGGKRS